MEFSDDLMRELADELKPCGCGSEDLIILLDCVWIPDSDDRVGYVVECMVCGIKTRQVADPYRAQAIWNATFRNNSDVLKEINDLRDRVEKLESKR